MTHSLETTLTRSDQNRDIRDPLMRDIASSGMYDLPFVTRRMAVNSLLMHSVFRDDAGIRIAWDVRMNFDWDRSGHMKGGEETDPTFDASWALTCKGSTIFTTAAEAALAPYIRDTISPLGLSGARMSLSQEGRKGGFLTLNDFEERDMRFSGHGDLRRHLEGLDDSALSTLWTCTRVLDSDLCRANRILDMRTEYNALRADMEQDWAMEIESDIDEGLDDAGLMAL